MQWHLHCRTYITPSVIILLLAHINYVLINYVKRTRRPDSEFAIVELTPAVALAVLAVHSLAIAKTDCTFTFLSN